MPAKKKSKQLKKGKKLEKTRPLDIPGGLAGESQDGKHKDW